MGTFIDVVRPDNRSLGLVFDGIAIAAGSLFLALLAQVSIPIGPVPFTLQTLAVLMLGALLGSKRSSLAVVCYLTEGALGLPVFAGGGAGVLSLAGPTGGYFLGFIICAYIVGYLLERGWRGNYFLTLIAMATGSAVILLLGAFWLSFFIGSENALHLGLYPFIMGDMVKALLAAILIPSGWKALDFLR